MSGAESYNALLLNATGAGYQVGDEVTLCQRLENAAVVNITKIVVAAGGTGAGATYEGTTTVTTAAAHGLNNGDPVDIAGIAGAGANLNGARTVLAAGLTATKFTFAAVAGVAADTYTAAGGATATCQHARGVHRRRR